jgi:hypothetical protein
MQREGEKKEEEGDHRFNLTFLFKRKRSREKRKD